MSSHHEFLLSDHPSINVKVIQRPDYPYLRVRSREPLGSEGSRYLGELDQTNEPDFIAFLNKFGYRMRLDDLTDNFIFRRDYTRWSIRSDLLLTAYRLWKNQKRETFCGVVKNAKNGKDFMAITAVG